MFTFQPADFLGSASIRAEQRLPNECSANKTTVKFIIILMSFVLFFYFQHARTAKINNFSFSLCGIFRISPKKTFFNPSRVALSLSRELLRNQFTQKIRELFLHF
jgi:hypothetical protein